MQKVRRNVQKPCDCYYPPDFKIFSLPTMGSFHRSLTVLLRYRSEKLFRFRRWSSYIRTDQTYSVLLLKLKYNYSTGPLPSSALRLCKFPSDISIKPNRLSLTTTSRISVDFFPWLLRCFNSPSLNKRLTSRGC
jgi:hypothetical protein